MSQHTATLAILDPTNTSLGDLIIGKGNDTKIHADLEET
jgi:hypothetical protein